MNEAARALVLEHWQWAAELARRQARKVSVLDADEVAGDALVALVEAARRFKPGRGVKFRSFARHRIHGAVRDHQMRITESRVCQLAGEACRTLRDIIAEDPRGSP